MNRARAYVLATVTLVLLASLGLWLVPGAVRQAMRTPGAEAVPPNMTFREALAQVDSAVLALGDGMIRGDVALALSQCDTSDAAWAAEQGRVVEEVHARLAGHPGRLLYPRRGSYSVIRFGQPDSVSTSVHSGALMVQDTLTGQIVNEGPYLALARYGRFRLVPPGADEYAHIRYRQSLGALYYTELGRPDQALAILRQILADFPRAEGQQRLGVYRSITWVLEEDGDFAGAAVAYEQALGLAEDGLYTPLEINGQQMMLRQSEGIKYNLARCALRAGQKDKARRWCEELATSENGDLAAVARAILGRL